MATKCGIQFRKGLYPEAIELGKRAIRAAGSGADPAQVAYAQNMTGLALAEAGQLKEGARYLRRAVKSYHEARDFSGQASANSNLGSTYQLLGMYDAALYHYSVALTADGRTGDEIDAAITHNNMAESLLLLDREDEALSRLEDVLKTAANEPDLTDLEGWAHVAIARCLRAKGDLDAAAEHLARGLRLLRAVGSTGLLTEAQVDWAEEALAEGDAKLGLRRANRALKQAEEIDSRLAEARAQRVAGECLVAMGRMEDSEARLAAAVAACRRVAAEHEEAHASMALGRLYLVNGRRGGARRLTRRAHRIFTRAGSTRQVEAAAALVREAEA
jgi:tetratricopeptide (TPR) repeat protein